MVCIEALRSRKELFSLSQIAGHEDLDTARLPATDDPSVVVPRKLDPGPLFPWNEVLPGSGLTRIRASH